METKICRVCQRKKPLSDFPGRYEGTGKLRNECRVCDNAYKRMRYLERLGKFKRTVRAENREADPKRCIRCGKTKPLSEFTIHHAEKGQHRNMCKDCVNAWTKEYNKTPEGQKVRGDYREQYKDRNKELQEFYRNDPVKRKASKKYHRKYWLMKQFGLTPDDYDRMLNEQNNGCAICGADDPRNKRDHFAIDHDHETDEIRGLLCQGCNTGIGLLGDDIERLEAAAAYLRKHKHG